MQTNENITVAEIAADHLRPCGCSKGLASITAAAVNARSPMSAVRKVMTQPRYAAN